MKIVKIVMSEMLTRVEIKLALAGDIMDYLTSNARYKDVLEQSIVKLKIRHPGLTRDEVSKLLVEEQSKALRFLADTLEERMVKAMNTGAKNGG